jgi:hypothetical protein
MKTLTLFFFIIFTATLTATAQITKGNWLVGGSGSFSTSTATSENTDGTENTQKSIGSQINPNLGYFLSDKLAVGLDLSLSFSNPAGSDNSNWAIGLGPFLRYYFLPEDNQINLFSQASVRFNNGLSEINRDSKSTTLGLSAGGVVFFNNSVGLELSLNYEDRTFKRANNPDSKLNSLFLGLGFQIHLEK